MSWGKMILIKYLSYIDLFVKRNKSIKKDIQDITFGNTTKVQLDLMYIPLYLFKKCMYCHSFATFQLKVVTHMGEE